MTLSLNLSPEPLNPLNLKPLALNPKPLNPKRKLERSVRRLQRPFVRGTERSVLRGQLRLGSNVEAFINKIGLPLDPLECSICKGYYKVLWRLFSIRA